MSEIQNITLANQVLLIVKGNPILMYDFGSSVGDTLQCGISNFGTISERNFIVKDKVIKENLGVNRQNMSMDYVLYPFTPISYDAMKWIEGIGSLLHPFYSLSPIVLEITVR